MSVMSKTIVQEKMLIVMMLYKQEWDVLKT